MKTKKEITDAINAIKPRGAWAKARKIYALELIESSEGHFTPVDLLNGARNWKEYSEDGCALIYNEEIARRVCSPSEFKYRREGEMPPNVSETWLECQARCLTEAAALILKHA